MASAYLSRTPSSNGNRKTWTFSAWCKVQKDSNETIFDVGTNGGNNYTPFFFQNDQAIRLYEVVGGSLQSYNLITNRKFRDRNAWYHLVYRVDTTQSTSSDRIRLYVNGVQETSFSTAAYPAQNYDTLKNSTSYANVLGVAADNYGANFYDGMMAHVHFCDGQSYAPTVFGETDATTGIWKPKTAPSVNYGTNGFFLRFDNSANMGLDSSGQGNNFSTSGTIIQTKDTPSNVFCTLNPLDFGVGSNNATLSLVNTKAVSGGANWRHSHGTLGVTSGKYYFEGKQGLNSDGDTGYVFGFCDQQYDTTDDPNSGTPNAKFYGRQGTTFYTPSGKTDNYFPGSSAGDILMVALDLDNNKIWFGTNGTWHNTNGSAGNTSYSSTTLNSSYPDATSVTIDTSKAGVYMPMIGSYNDGYIEANFGNGYFATTAVSSAQNPDDGVGIFEYDVPAGFRALCTKSLNAEEYS